MTWRLNKTGTPKYKYETPPMWQRAFVLKVLAVTIMQLFVYNLITLDSAMPNIVIQQIKIANHKNIFLMLIKSNCRLRIINGPSEK